MTVVSFFLFSTVTSTLVAPFLLYLGFPGMPTIDDTDPAITYSGGWSVDGSLHSTTIVGSTATIRFTGTRAT